MVAFLPFPINDILTNKTVSDPEERQNHWKTKGKEDGAGDSVCV